MSVTKEIVFTKYSENPHRLYIPIINDCDCVEEYEYFLVNITTYMDCVHLPVEYVHITIIDDDSELQRGCTRAGQFFAYQAELIICCVITFL